MTEVIAVAALFFVLGLMVGSVLGHEAATMDEPTENGPFGR